MYIPEVFRENDRDEIAAMIRACSLATMVTVSEQGLLATPLPMFLVENEEEQDVLHGHIARANPQWKETSGAEALVIFQGPNAYITPNWYPSKVETAKVVPTWNYVAVHAYGPVEFYDDPKRLLEVVSKLTDFHEGGRKKRWSVDEAPAEYIEAQLHGIVGVRIPVCRIEAKRKLSQNQTAANRAGAKAGLLGSLDEGDRVVGGMIR
jgi:transcriptional regulator